MGVEVPQDWQATVASALDWWRDAGVDAVIAEEPRDWLARIVPATAPPADEPILHAAPRFPTTLVEFEIWRASDAAPEAAWSDRRILAAGDPTAELMILVDMPDREDIESGVLISGAMGRLFDRMLAAIGRDRESVYLAAVCVARPNTGRVVPEFADRLAEIAKHHVALVAPKRLLLLGHAPSRAFLSADFTHARGSLHPINLTDPKAGPGDHFVSTQAVASFHPRLLLEKPACKADAWKDLQMLVGDLNS